MNRRHITIVGGSIALAEAILGSSYQGHLERQRYGADVATICNAETSSQTMLERNRNGVEEWARSHLRTERARTFLARLRREAPDVAAVHLRSDSASADSCPTANGYEALARRIRLQQALDKMCREFEPRALERAPRATRVRLLLAWSREHLGDEVEPVLGPLRDLPLEDAVAELRQRLADLEVHVCSMLTGLAAPTSPKPGPNVLLEIARIDDAREPDVTSALRARLPAIERCYAAELANTPTLAGRLDIKLRLTPKGTVDLALPQEDSTLQSAAVVGCAVAEIRNIAVDAGATPATGGAAFDLFVVN